MKVLDANGVELKVGMRVTHRDYGGYRTVVRLIPPFEGVASIGHWHGSLDEYRPHMCIPYVAAEEVGPDTYRCPDLIALTSKQEGERR